MRARHACALPLLAAAVALILVHPLNHSVLLAGSALLFFAAWRWPHRIPTILLVLLPVANLAPFSGRVLFTELDIVVLVFSAAHCMKYGWTYPRGRWNATLVAIVLLTAAACLSFVWGIVDSTTSPYEGGPVYLTEWNGLRLLRPLVWFWLLYPAFRDATEDHGRAIMSVADGMVGGLMLVSAVAVWERFLFPGLLDFSAGYRVVSSFASMHVGGSHIEAYLSITIPFLGLWALSRGHWARFAGVILFAASVYALVSAYSRAGVGAFFFAALVGTFGVAIILYRGRRDLIRRVLLSGAMAATVVFVLAWLVFEGQFLQHRFSVAAKDWQSRQAHWSDVLALRRTGVASFLLGEGTGRYPDRYRAWISEYHPKPGFRFIDDEEGGHLHLTGGGEMAKSDDSDRVFHPLFLTQAIDLPPEGQAHISGILLFQADVRPESDIGHLVVSLCEGRELYMGRCQIIRIAVSSRSTDSAFTRSRSGNDWQRVARTIDGSIIARATLPRPVRLNIYLDQPGTRLDVDNLRLLTPDGRNLIANGDFEQAGDYWFFRSLDHQLWNVDNLWVHMLFETGWLGVSALLLLVMAAGRNLFRGYLSGDAFAVTLAMSLGSAAALSMFGTLIDAPELTLLLLLLAALTEIARRRASGGQSVPMGDSSPVPV